MKKLLLFSFIAAVLPLALVSCSDDNSLPDVDYSIAISGGSVDENTGTIYVAQGDTLTVESISVINNEANKNAAITGAEYYWDYNFIGASPLPPYGFKVYVSDETPVGAHELTIRMGVAAVDKEPAIGIVNYNVEVVPAQDETPSTPVTPQTFTGKMSLKSLN